MDLYILSAERSAANPPLATAAVDRWDRHADGRTSHSYIDSVDSVDNAICRSDEFACRQHFLYGS